jgi:hypothetical protein
MHSYGQSSKPVNIQSQLDEQNCPGNSKTRNPNEQFPELLSELALSPTTIFYHQKAIHVVEWFSQPSIQFMIW